VLLNGLPIAHQGQFTQAIAILYEPVNVATAALNDWLSLRGDKQGIILCPVWKSEQIQVERGISTEAMTQMLMSRAAQNSIGKPITRHDFRRTFAGNLLEAGHELVRVQKLMDHAAPVTKSPYHRRSKEVKKARGPKPKRTVLSM
jgi:site-specific recombinase XerC